MAGKHTPIMNGDLIQPGSLLRAGEESSQHSLTILLPDGQRVLYECFRAGDCARGFRVPRLNRKPDPSATEMMMAIHEVLQQRDLDTSLPSADSRIARDEAIAILDSTNHIEISGLAATLPNGGYTYNLRPANRSYPRRSGVRIEKTSSSIKLELSGPGLYQVTIADQLNTPRISLFVSALKPGKNEDWIKRFHGAQGLLRAWNADYQGWPIHEFQRAYLEALALHVHPSPRATEVAVVEGPAPGITSEPTLSPRPGVFQNDVAVSLRCATAGAAIHYTVDGSQPFESSPVYHAPIIVKGTALTIKAYSQSEGRKDSAVVTGIFRIEEH